MCGITGFFAFNEIGRLFGIRLNAATKALAHRGPDFGRMHVSHYVGLGHRRLSIIDLSSAANQPMHDPTERFTIVFNGEIYNYKQIKEELLQQGITFDLDSDTEVLLKAYIHWGEKCLDKLVGFFAFAIYDKQDESVFVARDRFGIKPLFYFVDEDKCLFASEMNAMIAFNVPLEIDYQALNLYFQLNYIPAPYSIFKGVSKLLPGHFMRIRKGEVSICQYYQITQKKTQITYPDAQKQLLHLLENAVEDRMIADVPLGAFLSGGIDSSTVVALASKFTNQLKTFSVGYKDEPHFDETAYAQLVAEKYKTDHTVFSLNNNDIFEHIFELMGFFGEPFADSSQIPFYILSKRTKSKVTVALSGDGADEIFAGYNKYMGFYQASRSGAKGSLIKAMMPLLNKLPKSRGSFWSNKFRQMHRFGLAAKLPPQDRYWFLSSVTDKRNFPQIFAKDFLDKVSKNDADKIQSDFTKMIRGEDINDVLQADMQLVLQNDMLVKVDMMSMAHALEVRVPFLDHRVVDFAFGLPENYKINPSMKKRVLQDAVRPLLPEKLYKRPKKGFDVPLAKGYQTVLRPWVEQMLDNEFVVEQKIFNPAYIQQLKKTIFSTQNFDQAHVWGILAFQFWWKNIFKVDRS